MTTIQESDPSYALAATKVVTTFTPWIYTLESTPHMAVSMIVHQTGLPLIIHLKIPFSLIFPSHFTVFHTLWQI